MNMDEKFMYRCLQLAELGLGRVAPNPMVGCVIAYDDKIIGEGYHHQYGDAHAEVNAINSVTDKELLSKAVLYVNLEPCAHYGKTPPCADLIIALKIPKVIIGCADIFHEVNGKGIEKLKTAGVDVCVNVLQQPSLDLNKRFFTYHHKKRPYIILKWAQSADGFIAAKNNELKGEQGRTLQWISNKQSRILVHKWRTQEAAIMVGTNTALKDNPKLNARLWHGKNPLRIVLDRKLRLPSGLSVFKKDIPTLVYTESEKPSERNLQFIKIDFNNLVCEVLHHLYKIEIQSVIVEGGAELLSSFISSNFWDEARVFKSNRNLVNGVAAPHIPGDFTSLIKIEDDQLYIIHNVQAVNI